MTNIDYFRMILCTDSFVHICYHLVVIGEQIIHFAET